MKARKNVLLIEPTIHPVGVKLLQENVHVIFAPDGKEETLISSINEHNVHAVLTRMEDITDNIIDACPSLELLGKHGIGVDNISVKATEEGIAVINVPNGNITAVVEYTFSTMLALSKHLKEADQHVREGKWQFREEKLPGEINNKTLLIVGLGAIGQQIARMANSFQMKVLGYDPYVSKEMMATYYAEKVEDLAEGIKQADYIDIHVPLINSTKDMFSEKEFDLMKETAFVINASRGGVVNEQAMYVALKENKIAGAAIDVYNEEPLLAGDSFITLDNVLLTPHIAGVSNEAKIRSAKILAEDTIRAMNGQIPKNLVNPMILGKAKFLRNDFPVG